MHNKTYLFFFQVQKLFKNKLYAHRFVYKHTNLILNYYYSLTKCTNYDLAPSQNSFITNILVFFCKSSSISHMVKEFFLT